MNNNYDSTTQSPSDDYAPSTDNVSNFYTKNAKRRRKMGGLATLVAGLTLMGSPGCVSHRPGLEGFFNPYAERVDWGNAQHANGYQAFMENDHPEGATGSIVQEFAPLGYVADTIKFPFLMMRKGFYAIGDHRPDNPVGAFFSYVAQAVLYLGHPINELIELINCTPFGRDGFRVFTHIAKEKGAYQREVNYGHGKDEPVLLNVPENEQNKLALYDALKVGAVTGAAAGGVVVSGGDSGGSSHHGGTTTNPIPPIPPGEPGLGDGF